MAKQFVVRPLYRGQRESAEGVSGINRDYTFSGRQMVVYADSKVEALAQGEERLGIRAANLEAIEIDL